MGLFKDFEKVSQQDWIDKINIDLKGKDFQETLVWSSNEGINVEPFYNSTIPPSPTPLKANNNWKIRESVFIDNISTANKNALEALKGGANSILFVGDIKSQTEMDMLLKDIQTDIIEVHFYSSKSNPIAQFVNLNEGSISYDSLKENDLNNLIELINNTQNLKCITITSTPNDSIINELALGLSKGVEYINLLTDKGIPAETIAKRMQFTFGISTNYFFEIAKLRAARKLWTVILNQFDVKDTSMNIHSETSVASSSEDLNFDILRNTTKAMSAIIGGCDSLTVRPHDKEKLNFSNRIARNVQHLLKEEAFFDKVKNPADGAYYIEFLTEEIAKKTWGKFQEIEAKGGYQSYTTK